MVNNTTPHLGLQLPDPSNPLNTDVLRIISSFNTLDTAVDAKVTMAQVNTAIQAVVGSAPAALDTLAEIATQLASDESAAAALVTTVAAKVAKTDIVDALTSAATNQPLSANQGKALSTLIAAKQAALVSGTTIKTVGGQSLLGSGDITISTSTNNVVSAAYTMPSAVASGGSLALALTGTSALVGGSVASFEVTDWNAAVTTTAATANAASKTLTASTTVGQVLSVSVVAIDNYGNRSLPVVKTATVVSVSINAVTITSPANAATGITATPTISGNSFGVTNGTDAQVSADWEIWTGANRTGTLVWSSINDTTNKTSITVPAATLVVNTTYYIAARYKGTTYGYGGYGYCSFTTATSFVPSVAGAAYRGGFFAGKIVVGGSTYALVVAPKASGENTSKQWKTSNDTTAGTLSLNDGLSNSNAMNNASHPAAQFCRALTIGGYSDWYLPSRDELEIVYRNCKPDSTANTVYASRLDNWGATPGQYNGVDSNGNGYNANSLPVGTAYTTSNPTTSVSAAYVTGGAEAFGNSWYWSSTEFYATYAWRQYFGSGSQDSTNKTFNLYVRAVRKVLI